jgi:hypothetical protein
VCCPIYPTRRKPPAHPQSLPSPPLASPPLPGQQRSQRGNWPAGDAPLPCAQQLNRDRGRIRVSGQGWGHRHGGASRREPPALGAQRRAGRGRAGRKRRAQHPEARPLGHNACTHPARAPSARAFADLSGVQLQSNGAAAHLDGAVSARDCAIFANSAVSSGRALSPGFMTQVVRMGGNCRLNAAFAGLGATSCSG